jgi:hypothetical protein
MDNPRAFPNTGNSTWGMQPAEGMTLRDWFAGQALAMSVPDTPKNLAEWTYMVADAMLAARQEQGK